MLFQSELATFNFLFSNYFNILRYKHDTMTYRSTKYTGS